MVFNVALLGHSQLPNNIPEDDGIVYHIFKQNGATLNSLDHEPLRSYFNHHFDLTIFFLGGNDVVHFKHDTVALANLLRTRLRQVKQNTRQVVFVTLEGRNYDHYSRFDITSQEYNEAIGRINRSLVKFCRRVGHKTIVTHNFRFVGQRRNDGVHFNQQAIQLFITKVKTVANYVRTELAQA